MSDRQQKTADDECYPRLPETAGPETQDLSLIKFTPDTSSRLHEHTGWEEFIVLEGNPDPDGTT